MKEYSISVVFVVEAQSELHAGVIIERKLKNKGVIKTTDDIKGYQEIRIVEKSLDNKNDSYIL